MNLGYIKNLVMVLTIMSTIIAPGLMFASEVTGALYTTNQSSPTDYSPSSAALLFTVVDGTSSHSDWDLPIVVKGALIGGVVLEVLILITLYAKKAKLRYFN